MEAVLKACKEISPKEIKSREQDQVKFDAKEKGKKPVITKGICFFSVTGEFNVDKLSETLNSLGVRQLE